MLSFIVSDKFQTLLMLDIERGYMYNLQYILNYSIVKRLDMVRMMSNSRNGRYLA